MQTSYFTLPSGYVHCDLCGCVQPLSCAVSYEDGYICIPCKPFAEAQLAEHAEQHRILSQESKH